MDDARLDLDAPQAAPWFRALHLMERLPADAPASDEWIERGSERFGRWRAEQGVTDAFVARRLATAQLTEAQWHALLGEPEEALHARMRANAVAPDWLRGLLDDLNGGTDTALLREHPWEQAPPNAGFLALVEPMLEAGAARLRQRTRSNVASRTLPFAQLLDSIRTRLLTLVERTLILEMHIAGLTGELAQEDPAERYHAFVERLADRDVRITTLRTYPVLARSAWTYIDQWVRHTAELLEALDDDADDLNAVFGDLGAPTSVRAVDSDPHRDGRHVWFVDFAGESRRVVFKPRPCRAEAAFQAYVQNLNDEGLDPQLRVIAVLDRGTHGWLEYVEAHALSSAEQAHDFHRRQGAWLVALWTLACNDMHYENIRASGEHPVPIDHETVLRNRLGVAPSDNLDYVMDDVRGDSVTAIGLLPTPHWDEGFGGYIDQSGMGVGYDDAGTVTGPSVVGTGAEMRIEAAVINPERQHNRAEFDGELLDPRNFVEAVEEGFTSAWQHVAARRDDADARLAVLDDATARMVLRPTQNYIHLLHVLGHPEYLQDAIECERALLQLWMYPEPQQWREPTVESERRQLLMGDVPWFGAVATSRDVLAGDDTVIPGIIDVRGYDVARQRFAEMDAQRFDVELWEIRASLARRDVGTPVPLVVHERTVSAIADELVRDLRARSIRSADMRSWFILQNVGAGQGPTMRFVPEPAKLDLYSGRAGIALALGAHGLVTGSQPSLDAARETLNGIRADRAPLQTIGAYDGAAGLVWTFMQLAEWLDDAFLLDAAEEAARTIEGAIEHDRTFDIISGAAGCVPVLLELERVRPGALDLAMRCGNHLLEHVTSLDVLPFERGFSHGASGVAWALTRLSHVTGEQRWAERANELLAAEDERIGGDWWADHADNPHFAAWCHGAPGIALARADIACMSGAGDAQVLEAAISAACAAESHDSHGLCHGELGNVDALFEVARLLDRDDVRAEARRRLERVLVEIRSSGARSTGPRYLPTPGLLLGTSGIAWSLLRSEAPERIPSVLLPGTIVRSHTSASAER